VELENTLEKEQESLVNRLWKRMDKLETDKKLLQLKIQQPHSYNTVRIYICFPDRLYQTVLELRVHVLLDPTEAKFLVPTYRHLPVSK
jgi:hypothetical protein